MTDAELNDLGRDVIKLLHSRARTPGDAMSALVYVIMVLWEFRPSGTTGDFADFATGFRDHCVATHKANSPDAQPMEYKLQ